MKNENTVLIISGQVVSKNSKVNWPDLNYPNSGQTILRTVHNVDYDALSIHLDGVDGPIFKHNELPEGVGFFKLVEKKNKNSK
jgi:hypothetical protein